MLIDPCYGFWRSFYDRPAAFSHNGGLIAAHWDDNIVRLWNISSSAQLRPLLSHPDPVTLMEFSEGEITSDYHIGWHD